MHLRPTLRSALVCLLALCGSGALPAQSTGFSADLKLRYGYTPNPQDHLYNSTWGGGFNFAYGLGPGKLGLEIGYRYKGGDLYIEPIQTQIPTGGQPLESDPGKVGGDARRNRLDGISVRLSWQAPLVEGWEWQAGLMLGGTRFRHEYHGDITSAEWSTSGAGRWRDFYYGTPTKGGISPSLFGGVAWKFDEDTTLELNVLLTNYKAINYVHRAGAGVYDTSTRLGQTFPQDSMAEKRRIVPELEIAYVLHL